MLDSTPFPIFVPLELSKRDSRLFDKLEMMRKTDLNDIDTIIEKVAANLAEFGAVPQRQLDKLDAIIAKAERITDNVERKGSDALDPYVAEVRLVIEAKIGAIEATKEALPEGGVLSQPEFKAVKKLTNIEENALDKLDSLIARIEAKIEKDGSAPDKLYDRFDNKVEKLLAKTDGLDDVLGEAFDGRIEALRAEFQARLEQVDEIRNGEPEAVSDTDGDEDLTDAFDFGQNGQTDEDAGNIEAASSFSLPDELSGISQESGHDGDADLTMQFVFDNTEDYSFFA